MDKVQGHVGQRAAAELERSAKAQKHGQLRVVDESGEDYLYPAEIFIEAEFPQSVRRAVLQAA